MASTVSALDYRHAGIATMVDRQRIRIEYRTRARSKIICRLENVFSHHTVLDPFISRYLQDGREGSLYLIDEQTGAVLVRREIRPFQAIKRPKAGKTGPRRWTVSE